MHYLFSNIKYLLRGEQRDEEDFYASLGISHETIFQLVTGNASPSPEQLMLIADALGRNIDELLRNDLSRFEQLNHSLKMFVMDVDGVLTDAGMYYTDSGLEIKKYNAKDGMAIMRLEKNGVRTGMLSHGFNRTLIKSRAEMLGVSHYYTGQEKKWDVLESWLSKSEITPEETVYIGDDINDLAVMKRVGLSAAPADAAKTVKKHADLVLKTPGGHGCVRELAELLFPDFFSEP